MTHHRPPRPAACSSSLSNEDRTEGRRLPPPARRIVQAADERPKAARAGLVRMRSGHPLLDPTLGGRRGHDGTGRMGTMASAPWLAKTRPHKLVRSRQDALEQPLATPPDTKGLVAC